MAKAKRASNAGKMNARYFLNLLELHGMSQADLAKHLKLKQRASVNHLLSGLRKLQVEEAVEIARLFSVPLEDVLNNAGIPTSGLIQKDSLPISGSVEGRSLVHFGPVSGSKKAPPPNWSSGKNLGVLRYQTVGTPLESLNGGLIYFRQSETISPDDVGRLAIISERQTSKDHAPEAFLGVMKRSTSGKYGQFDIYSAGGELIKEACSVESASPVLLIKI